MQPVKINIVQPLTTAELFFVQKSAELLHKETIDTYRLRLNNPRTVLQELIQVTSLIESKSLREEYGKVLADEALEIVRKEEILNFSTITKNHILKILAEKNSKDIFYAANILVFENRDYAEKLFAKIGDEISRINGLGAFSPAEFDLLNKLIGYFYIELKAKGYSKAYLNNFVRTIFTLSKNPLPDFSSALAAIKTLINRQKEKFTVYLAFKVPIQAANQLQIASTGFLRIPYADLQQEAAQINNTFKNFVTKNNKYHYYKMEVDALDFHSAAYLVKRKMQTGLDLIFMGHSSQMIKVFTSCFIVGSVNPKKGNRYNLEYQLDGYFASDQTLYLQFLDKVKDLENKQVDEISKRKINAALRYLRLGTESEELENKLLNYWIAIEYLFSAVEADQDKVKRLREYYKKIHSVSYASKLFKYTHEAINSLGLIGNLTLYNATDYSYIIQPQTLAELNGTANTNPLIAYRVYTLSQRFADINSIKSEFSRHQNNVERNIVRIYRTRNEIVHTASYENNILDITAHVRYYLTFIINGFIDFVMSNPIDVNKDGKISIDDYFSVLAVQLDSLLLDDVLDINKLLKFKNPVEYLT
ncbi:MAG: hypothetical protein E6H07_08565 [Bacteroidetes bacterium]|nr:MAG: hypothetical protein E6H07_08565 [Bacteroidota bacterium]